MPSPAALFPGATPDWQYFPGLTPYPDALQAMEEQVAGIIAGTAPEQVWLLEHPPVYTAGTSARDADLLNADRFPVYKTGRGGEYTYHGPGQRIAYVMLDLKARSAALGSKPDLRTYVQKLEQWIIATLATFGVPGVIRENRIGVWVVRPDGREEKIAALGVRIRKWVSFHGIALNVCPDLSHFSGIIPCGIHDHGVTSLKALGTHASMEEVDAALAKTFETIF